MATSARTWTQQKTQAVQSGIAYLELAIILAILTPLMVSFAFVWLPDFSRRSNELMNALASLGACLVDPLNLYAFKGGQLTLRDDYQQIVQGVVSTCGQMSEGETACGFVIDSSEQVIFRYGLNETPDAQCSSVDVKQCLGKDPLPAGLVVAFMLKSGVQCEHTPADDSGSDGQRGDESGGAGSVSFDACPGVGSIPGPFWGFYVAHCEPAVPPYTRYYCCKPGTVFNSVTYGCEGCPTGTHGCFVSAGSGSGVQCLDDSNPRYSGGACCHRHSISGTGYCSDNEQDCTSGIPSNTPYCCPLTGGTCADFASAGFSGCYGVTIDCGCPATTVSSTPSGCINTFQEQVPNNPCKPVEDGDLIRPPGNAC